VNGNFKDQSAGSVPPNGAPPASAANQQSCHEHSNAAPRKLPARSLQLADVSTSPVSTAIGKGTITRVLARLRDGQSEQWIARKEDITIAQVNKIRAAYFALIPRAFAIFRMERENAQDLFTELEQDVLDQEVA
jgi:hypothetical protein